MQIKRRDFLGTALATGVAAGIAPLGAQPPAAPAGGRGRNAPPAKTWFPKVERLFKSPDLHPNALEAAPDGLWVGDQVSEKVHKLDWNTGATLFELQTESHNDSGLAVGAGYFWIGSNGSVRNRRPARPTDRPYGELRQIDMKTGKAVKTFRMPWGGGIHGVAFNHQTGTLWVTALSIDAVAELDINDNMRILKMFPVGNSDRAHGLDFDNGMVWVMFAGEREARKFDPDGGRVLEIVTLSKTSDPDPHGMCIHNGYMYYCDAGLTALGPGSEPRTICRFRLDAAPPTA